MSRKMLINASHPEENRVAIVVDGILSELDIEIAGQEQTKGNIYKAVVVRVETGLQAAFVDYGAEKLGFLQIGEIHPSIYPKKDEIKGRPRIAEILQRGQEILVQIVKEERGNKGAALTTFLSIPGRYMVLMPDSTTKGVSRKISLDSERKKLKKTMAELDLPEKMGYIVRTAGIGKDKEELKRDFDYLVRLYEGIVARKDQVKAPAQLYQESNLAIRSIRDYFSTEMDEVLIDSPQVYQDTRDFFALVMPELKYMVKRHRERRPIFSRYQIEEQIEGLVKNQTALPSGGSIVMDQTEALVAIDVNSGKMASESGIEATALKTNLEAATEVGRQLRLRDLGGLIVIDFIDMRDRKNIREVEQQLKNALKEDKAKVSVGRISQFGLMEMSRQRLKPTLSVGAYESCPHCKGAGKIRSIEAQAVSIMRQAHTAASKGQVGQIEATVPVEVANYLLNQKRATIIELERQLNLRLNIQGRIDMLPGESELELHKKEKEQNDNNQIMPVSHANQIDVALAAQLEEQNKPTEQEAPNTTEPEQIESATSETPNKRRRRRRKKPAASTSQAEQKNTTEEQPSAEKPTITTEPAEQEVPLSAEASEKETEQQEKPKRQTRRPARQKVQSEKKPLAATADQNPEQAEEQITIDKTVTESVITPTDAVTTEERKKPARARRPRRTSKKTTENLTNSETLSAESTAKQQTVTIEGQNPSAKTQVGADSKNELIDNIVKEDQKSEKKRRPSPRKKATPAKTTTTSGEKPVLNNVTIETVSENGLSTEKESLEQQEPLIKPKRRSRRTVKKASAEQGSTVTASEPDELTTPATGAETVQTAQGKEPKKPQRRTRKTVNKEKELLETMEDSQQETTTEQKKPKRTPRRVTKKAPSAEAREESGKLTEHPPKTTEKQGLPEESEPSKK